MIRSTVEGGIRKIRDALRVAERTSAPAGRDPIPLDTLTQPLSLFADLPTPELEHLGRLGTPLYKAAGSDRYEPIGWNGALSHAADRLRQTQPDRTFFHSSDAASNEAGFLFQLFARAYGTNHVNSSAYYSHQASDVGLGSTIGAATATIEPADLAACDLIVVIGAGASFRDPSFMGALRDCRARGGEVIVIDPARAPGLAGDYIQPRIGGDPALFKGLAKALLEVGGLDRYFVADHTTGFDEFYADLGMTTWDEIERGSGLARAEIRGTAFKLAAARNAVFAWSTGATQHLHGSETVELIACLALMLGQVGRPGAGLLPLRGHGNVQGLGTVGVKPVLPADVFNAIEQSFGIALPHTKGYDTIAGLEAAREGKVDAAVIMGGNLLEATPNREFAQQALGRIGFRLFLTTTLNRGHVEGVEQGEVLILPVTTRDEEWEPTTRESMFNFVRLSNGGSDRLDNVRPVVAILADLAHRVLPLSKIDFPSLAQHRRIREAIAATIPGMESLADIDVAKREFPIKGRLLHTPEFNTVDGKAKFVVRPLPAPHEPGLVLAAVRSEGQFNSIVHKTTDFSRGNADRMTAMLHPKDIAAAGFAEGDRAALVSAHGRMPAVTLKACDVAPGSVLAYYPEANVLVGTAVDPRSRTPAFKATPVRLERE